MTDEHFIEPDEERDPYDWDDRKMQVWMRLDGEIDAKEAEMMVDTVSDALGPRFQPILTPETVSPISKNELREILLSAFNLAGETSIEDIEDLLTGGDGK